MKQKIKAKDRTEVQMKRDLLEHQIDLLEKKINSVESLKRKLKKMYDNGDYSVLYGQEAYTKYKKDIQSIKQFIKPICISLLSKDIELLKFKESNV